MTVQERDTRVAALKAEIRRYHGELQRLWVGPPITFEEVEAARAGLVDARRQLVEAASLRPTA